MSIERAIRGAKETIRTKEAICHGCSSIISKGEKSLNFQIPNEGYGGIGGHQYPLWTPISLCEKCASHFRNNCINCIFPCDFAFKSIQDGKDFCKKCKEYGSNNKDLEKFLSFFKEQEDNIKYNDDLINGILSFYSKKGYVTEKQFYTLEKYYELNKEEEQ